MSQQLEILTENPTQWNAVTLVTPDVQKKEIKPFVLLALKELEGNPDSRTKSLLNADKFAAVRSVVRHVARVRSASKEPCSHEDMKIFLEGLRFSQECIPEFATLLCTETVYEDIPKHLRLKPGLASLHWKIDISLSQSLLTPSSTEEESKEIIHRSTYVILTLSLTNGETRTYRLSVAKFHELRFVVASALKSLIVLEKRKCMRRD